MTVRRRRRAARLIAQRWATRSTRRRRSRSSRRPRRARPRSACDGGSIELTMARDRMARRKRGEEVFTGASALRSGRVADPARRGVIVAGAGRLSIPIAPLARRPCPTTLCSRSSCPPVGCLGSPISVLCYHHHTTSDSSPASLSCLCIAARAWAGSRRPDAAAAGRLRVGFAASSSRAFRRVSALC